MKFKKFITPLLVFLMSINFIGAQSEKPDKLYVKGANSSNFSLKNSKINENAVMLDGYPYFYQSENFDEHGIQLTKPDNHMSIPVDAVGVVDNYQLGYCSYFSSNKIFICNHCHLDNLENIEIHKLTDELPHDYENMHIMTWHTKKNFIYVTFQDAHLDIIEHIWYWNGKKLKLFKRA